MPNTYENATLARYNTVNGYFIGASGEYKIGDIFGEIGEIQSVEILDHE